MTATTDTALVDQVAKVFRLACRKQDWEVAEFLLRALEAIAEREGDDALLESAYGQLLELCPGRARH